MSRADLDAAPTVPNTEPDVNTLPQRGPASSPASIQGYVLGDVIGRGGMGEVVAARDPGIGREVAIKRLRGGAPGLEAQERFLREARIQARLDHPAVVPVYELGTDRDGRPYFTMKRLAGVTLHEHVARKDLPRARLLRAFADVCLAIELAHARGVVHRDLKPANIMLGGYGEVYVLDWGLARVLGDAEVAGAFGDSAELAGDTLAGTMLGTPGYMAPEQAVDATRAGRPADVYALGAILFELLAGEALHPPGNTAALASTLAGPPGSPAARQPSAGVPPELDALCAAALRLDPAQRPTAAALAAAVQGYLDGDRDVERRREIAVRELGAARAALAAGRRGEAMQAAGRAIALDPEARAAAELMTALMLEPPTTAPPELAAVLRASDADAIRNQAQASARAFATIVLIVPLFVWNGVQSWSAVGAVIGLACGMSAVAWWISRTPDRPRAHMLAYIGGLAALLAALSRLAGPFMFVPAVASFMAVSTLAYPVLARRPWPVVAMIVAGWMAPIALEYVGVLGSTWRLVDGALITTSHAIVLEGNASIAFIVLANLATVLIAGFHASRVAGPHLAARHQLVSQAWHLQQLVPAAAPDARA